MFLKPLIYTEVPAAPFNEQILFSHSISCGNTSLRFGIDKVIRLNNMYFAFQACMPFFAKNIGINSLFCKNTPRKF